MRLFIGWDVWMVLWCIECILFGLIVMFCIGLGDGFVCVLVVYIIDLFGFVVYVMWVICVVWFCVVVLVDIVIFCYSSVDEYILIIIVGCLVSVVGVLDSLCFLFLIL